MKKILNIIILGLVLFIFCLSYLLLNQDEKIDNYLKNFSNNIEEPNTTFQKNDERNDKCGEKQENSSIIYSNIKNDVDCNLVKEYNNLLKTFNFEKEDEFIKQNENLFIQLFDKNLIPKYKVISSGNKEIYMGLGDFHDTNKPETMNGKDLFCNTFDGESIEPYTSLCLMYIKNSSNKFIKVWYDGYDGKYTYFKKIDNQNLEFTESAGGVGGGSTKYRLFKIENENILENNSFNKENLYIEEASSYPSQGEILNYSKGNLSLIIYNDLQGKGFKYGIFKKIDNIQEKINYSSTNKKDALFKIKVYHKNEEEGKIIPVENKQFTNFNGKFEIDEKTNLMNGEKFEFLIDGKKFLYNTKDLKKINN